MLNSSSICQRYRPTGLNTESNLSIRCCIVHKSALTRCSLLLGLLLPVVAGATELYRYVDDKDDGKFFAKVMALLTAAEAAAP